MSLRLRLKKGKHKKTMKRRESVNKKIDKIYKAKKKNEKKRLCECLEEGHANGSLKLK